MNARARSQPVLIPGVLLFSLVLIQLPLLLRAVLFAVYDARSVRVLIPVLTIGGLIARVIWLRMVRQDGGSLRCSDVDQAGTAIVGVVLAFGVLAATTYVPL